MNRQGTNRKTITSPGLAGSKKQVVDELKEKAPAALAILKQKPRLLKATTTGTLEAINNYSIQKGKFKWFHTKKKKGLSLFNHILTYLDKLRQRKERRDKREVARA